MKTIRTAIIGQGRSGQGIHGDFLGSKERTKGRFQVTAVVEPIASRREKALHTFPGCQVYEDYTQLFGREDIDLVVNATTSDQHVPITRDFLRHGFNVLCEKPAAATAAEVDMLIETAEKAGKMYNVFQQSRFAPEFLKIREILDSGVLGRLIQVQFTYNSFNRRYDWQTLQACVGGGLYNSGPHPLDQALALLDLYDTMPNVFCKMDCVNTYGDANDYCSLTLTAPGKPLYNIEISSCDPYSHSCFKIMAEHGGLIGTHSDLHWKYFKKEEAPVHALVREPLSDENGNPTFCKDELVWYEEHWSVNDPGAWHNPVDAYYGMLYAYLTEGTPMEVTPRHVRQQIAIAEEAHRQNPLPKIQE